MGKYILNSFCLTGKLFMRGMLSLLIKIDNILVVCCCLIIELINKIMKIFVVLIVISLFISKDFRALIFDGVYWHTLIWLVPIILIKPICLFITNMVIKVLDKFNEKLDSYKLKTYF